MSNPKINFISFGTPGSQRATGSSDSSITGIGAAAAATITVPLVMLHGWGHSIVDLYQLGELLGETGPVYLVDLPGFGQSPEPESVWGTADYAQAVLEFMDQNGLAQVDLFGHSFGGRISIQISAAHPERVRRLILCNSAGLKLQPSIRKRIRLSAIRKTAAIIKWIDKTFGTKLFLEKFSPRFGSADYQRASGTMRNILVRTVNEDLANLIPGIRAETLLLWGSLDTETPIEAGRKIHQTLATSELVELENHGHEPFRGVGSHLLTFYIVPFLERGCKAIAAMRGGKCLVP